jgi:hypothetical protein
LYTSVGHPITNSLPRAQKERLTLQSLCKNSSPAQFLQKHHSGANSHLVNLLLGIAGKDMDAGHDMKQLPTALSAVLSSMRPVGGAEAFWISELGLGRVWTVLAMSGSPMMVELEHGAGLGGLGGEALRTRRNTMVADLDKEMAKPNCGCMQLDAEGVSCLSLWFDNVGKQHKKKRDTAVIGAPLRITTVTRQVSPPACPPAPPHACRDDRRHMTGRDISTPPVAASWPCR